MAREWNVAACVSAPERERAPSPFAWRRALTWRSRSSSSETTRVAETLLAERAVASGASDAAAAAASTSATTRRAMWRPRGIPHHIDPRGRMSQPSNEGTVGRDATALPTCLGRRCAPPWEACRDPRRSCSPESPRSREPPARRSRFPHRIPRRHRGLCRRRGNRSSSRRASRAAAALRSRRSVSGRPWASDRVVVGGAPGTTGGAAVGAVSRATAFDRSTADRASRSAYSSEAPPTSRQAAEHRLGRSGRLRPVVSARGDVSEPVRLRSDGGRGREAR